MARLGFDPFADDAGETVDVQVRREGAALSARVVRSGPEGEKGRRELSSPTTDCSELFRAVELAVAIAIDPRAGIVRPPAPVEPRAPEPAPAVVPPPPPPPVVAPEKPTPIQFQIGLGPSGSLGTGPTPTFGFSLIAGFRRGLLEIDLGGRVELPAGLQLQVGRLTTQVVVGNLSGCLAASAVRACVLGELGGLRVTSEGLTPPATQTAVMASLGVRLGLHFGVLQYLALRPFLDVAAALARTSVVADGRVVWATSPVMGTVGLVVLITTGS